MRIDYRLSEDLFPYQPRWLDHNGIRVHYVDEGTGRPILCLHGNPTSSFLYRGLIERLKQNFRCVAVDYPGFGLSDRPESGYGYTPREHAEVVEALVTKLDLNDLIVMGHDWGGPIGVAPLVASPWYGSAGGATSQTRRSSTFPKRPTASRRTRPRRWQSTFNASSAPYALSFKVDEISPCIRCSITASTRQTY